MTFWERLNRENPRAAEWETAEGTKVGKDCPCDYGYEKKQACMQTGMTEMHCAECWHREMEVVL